MIAIATAPAAEPPPIVCVDPGHARRPNLSREPIGPGSAILKLKDGGGAPGEVVRPLSLMSRPRSSTRARPRATRP